jgi:hypothetical protein
MGHPMQHRTRRVVAVGIVTSVLGAAGLADANAGACTLSGTTIVCALPIPCSDDAQCFATNGSRCAFASTGGGSCARDCSTMFACTSDTDCPTTPGLIGSCHASAIPMVSGLCEYHDAVTTRPFVSYCTSSPITFSDVARCYGTSDRWNAGDCDGDGLPNGTDAMPCTADPTGASLPPVPSPFCLHGHVCEGVSTVCAPVLTCTTADECGRVATRVMATGPWECSALPGTGTESYCHPSCFATAHCSANEACDPRFGVCTQVTGGTLAMCLPMALAACESNCASMPLDWASAQGDCDGDGAQNGCDPNPCRPGDPTCLFDHVCSIDAGVDAGGNQANDAGTDAGIIEIDAIVGEDAEAIDASEAIDARAIDVDAGAMDASAPRLDASGGAVDASTPTPSPGIGFSGGGGCRCAIVGGGARGGLALFSALAVVALARRRRR